MATVPRISAQYTQPASADRVERGWELLDQTRQWSYSRVMRKANLARHLESCRTCRARSADGRPAHPCSERTRLGAAVLECDRVLGQLREQPAVLDEPEPEPVPEPQPTLFA